MNTPRITRTASDALSESSDTDKLVHTLIHQLSTNRSTVNQVHTNAIQTSSSCYLSKIHPQFKTSDRNAFAPMVLSIGPHHYTAPSLVSIEKKKFDCLDYLVRLNCKKGLKHYLKAIKAVERETRLRYPESIGMDSITFLQMLLLDGSFILVYLHGLAGIVPTKRVITNKSVPEITEESDPVIRTGTDDIGDWYYSCIVHDLLLLENQIPFLVVKSLYRVLTGNNETDNLVNNIAGFLEEFFSSYPKAVRENNRPKDFEHLLHLLHFYFRPSEKPVSDKDHEKGCENSGFFQGLFGRAGEYPGLTGNMHLMRWRRALQYHEAGIEFVVREFDEQNPNSLLDIKFSKGVVEMPCIRIDQNTSYLFRNFVAMEQTSPKFGNDITAYVIFLAQLLSSADDVAFLSRKGIVSHQLRSDQEASDHLTKLTEGIVFDFSEKYYTKQMCVEMEKWYKNKWNLWNAWLKQNHFRNPFMGLIASVGIVMFVCGILQTVFAVLAFVKPQTIVLVQTQNGFKIAQ